MTEVHLNGNKKGAVGEALVFGGRHPPKPVSDTVKAFVKEQYAMLEDSPIRISTKRGLYYRLMTAEGEELTAYPDGGVVAEGSRLKMRTRSSATGRAGLRCRINENGVTEQPCFPLKSRPGAMQN